MALSLQIELARALKTQLCLWPGSSGLRVIACIACSYVSDGDCERFVSSTQCVSMCLRNSSFVMALSYTCDGSSGLSFSAAKAVFISAGPAAVEQKALAKAIRANFHN